MASFEEIPKNEAETPEKIKSKEVVESHKGWMKKQLDAFLSTDAKYIPELMTALGVSLIPVGIELASSSYDSRLGLYTAVGGAIFALHGVMAIGQKI